MVLSTARTLLECEAATMWAAQVAQKRWLLVPVGQFGVELPLVEQGQKGFHAGHEVRLIHT